VILAVHELKRLARNAAELMTLSAQLQAAGIQLGYWAYLGCTPVWSLIGFCAHGPLLAPPRTLRKAGPRAPRGCQ
jgi:hypothetical protein